MFTTIVNFNIVTCQVTGLMLSKLCRITIFCCNFVWVNTILRKFKTLTSSRSSQKCCDDERQSLCFCQSVILAVSHSVSVNRQAGCAWRENRHQSGSVSCMSNYFRGIMISEIVGLWANRLSNKSMLNFWKVPPLRPHAARLTANICGHKARCFSQSKVHPRSKKSGTLTVIYLQTCSKKIPRRTCRLLKSITVLRGALWIQT